MTGELAGLYLHVPFCSAVCPYCDFAVRVAPPEQRERYVEALLAEIDRVAATWELPFDTVYFGGGTPSILEHSQLERILDRLRKRFDLVEPRLFLEANPEDVTEGTLRRWHDLGVSFLSLGVQSFRDDELRFLVRRHTVDEARRAVSLARASDIERVSVDLIYGLPDQSIEAAEESRDVATALEPDHLSCYQLTVTPGTAFGRFRDRGRLVELEEGAQADHFYAAHRSLEAAGYPAYEVSNFARDEASRSRHNQKYWHHVPYLGLGPSAHSYRDRRRWWNVKRALDYQARIDGGVSPVEGAEELSASELALETLMLELRTPEGVSLSRFRERHGIDLLGQQPARIRRHEERGLLVLDGDRLRPTLAGMAVVDGLAASFELGVEGGT